MEGNDLLNWRGIREVPDATMIWNKGVKPIKGTGECLMSSITTPRNCYKCVYPVLWLQINPLSLGVLITGLIIKFIK